MHDVASMTTEGLLLLLDEGMSRRLDAVSPADRAAAGEDLLRVLDELRLRGCGPYGAPLASPPRPLPTPRESPEVSRLRRPEPLPGASRPAPGRPVSVPD